MNVVSRGVRNAFRNGIRTSSIILILSISVGLALSMLIARQAVENKIESVKSSIGNTITISPAGFNGFSQANNALSTDQLSKVKSLTHVTNLTETLTDRLTTIGSEQPAGPFSNSQSNNGSTSLTSPVKLNADGNSSTDGGPHIFINGGGSLPSNFSLPLQILGTTNPAKVNGSDVKITSGKAIDGTKDSNDALVSTDMASKNSLKLGSTFSAYDKTLSVIGIFDSGTQMGNNTIIVSLSSLQRLSEQSEAITNATATVDSLDNLSSTTSAVKKALGSSADVQSSQDQANGTLEPLKNIKNVSLFSLVGAVVAGAIITLLTMVMIVRERRREIGVLKAIGASNLKVMFQFMSEAVTFTFLAAIVGIIIGIAGAKPVTSMLVNNSTNNSSSPNAQNAGPVPRANGTARQRSFSEGGFNRSFNRITGTNIKDIKTAVGIDTALYGLGAAVVIALVGSAVPALLIAKVKPAEVMRVE